MAPSTTPTRRTSAGSTSSGACTSGSTARHSAATKPASGTAATTNTAPSDPCALGEHQGVDVDAGWAGCRPADDDKPAGWPGKSQAGSPACAGILPVRARQGVESETAAAKMSELPNVAGRACWTAGDAPAVPVRSAARQVSMAGQSAPLRTSNRVGLMPAFSGPRPGGDLVLPAACPAWPGRPG